LFCAALVSLFTACSFAPAQYEIKSLPGWTGALPSKMYSGFVNVGPPPAQPGTMHMHYWFVESESNPETDPLVLWYNGGPGASSLFGLLVELGPLLLNADSINNQKYNETKIPQLIKNPYSWSKHANILAVQNPPPVGFSYCDPIGPTGKGNSCGPWNDSAVATTNYKFLMGWFEDFPEFKKNDLYYTGESYAGVYVPTIVREILNNNPPGVNLKGFAVGDGCMGNKVLCFSGLGPYYQIEFMHGHGQFSEHLYRTIVDKCPEADLKSGNLSKYCQALVMQMKDEIGGYFSYSLYDECYDQNIFKLEQEREWYGPPINRPLTEASMLGGAVNDYPCPSDAMDLWLNRSDVREALNVAVDSYYFSGDNGAGFNYTGTEPDLRPFYVHVLEQTDLRVLVYNGDTDPAVNMFATQDIYFNYFEEQKVPKTHPWHPWTLDGKIQMAGYVTEWAKKFHYLTIRGSGHMVPEYKPKAAYTFFSKWLNNEEFPPYKPTP